MIDPAPRDPAPGLTSDEARRRLVADGPNQIAPPATRSWLRILGGQLAGAMLWLLAGAAVLAIALGDLKDALAIIGIIVATVLIGFVQEHRAERAMLALRALSAPLARVRRDGRVHEVAAREVVVGDLLVLDAGDLVAADAHLLEAHALRTAEATLTGESTPVDKRTAPVAVDAPLAERSDHVFAGTAVVAGSGVATVVAIGTRTELGQIADLLASAQEQPTPLQTRLERVGRVLAVVCVATAAVVAALGWIRGEATVDVLMSAISLAVAAVPEGLPMVVTVALAVGVSRMAARRVIVRRLPAVEMLGCATVIFSDKTGTLTAGTMVTRELWGPDETALLDAAAACCDAELAGAGPGGTGDPTELALLAAAAARGIHRAAIERARPRTATRPFDPDVKLMSIRRADGVLYVKGAPEVIIARCTSGADGASEAAARMAAAGLRVLAVATGAGADETGLALRGLAGLHDPPRPEAITAVAAARAAGVRTVMITGDHPTTARAIAGELGLLAPGDDAAEIVHARATAQDKLRIVRRWKERGAICAMTGDGVNDAPALREAHVGIAMGKAGTGVSREAADLVLTDDNFASVVAALQEGRGIFDRIRRTVVYLVAGNASELLIMLGAALAGWPLPLLPLHLLWINLVTDTLPALALVMDPTSAAVLRRPPRPVGEPLLTRAHWRRIAGTGAVEAAVIVAIFAWVRGHSGDLVAARGLAFSTLVLSRLLRAFAARSGTRIFWEVGAFNNLRLLGVVAATAALQLGLHHLALARDVLKLPRLSLADAGLLAAALVPVSMLELGKLLRRARARAGEPRGKRSSMRKSSPIVLAALLAGCGNQVAPPAGDHPAPAAGDARPADDAPGPVAALDAGVDAALTAQQREAYGDQLDGFTPPRAAPPALAITALSAIASPAAYCAARARPARAGALGRRCELTYDVHRAPPPFRGVQLVREDEVTADDDPAAARPAAALAIETDAGWFVRAGLLADAGPWADLVVTDATVVHGRLVVRYATTIGRLQVEQLDAVVICGLRGKRLRCTGELPSAYRKTYELKPERGADGDEVEVPLAPAAVSYAATVELTSADAVQVTPADPASAAWYGPLAGGHDLGFK